MFIIAAIQKRGLSLNLPARIVTDGVIGIITAAGWAPAIRADFNGSVDWFARGIIRMITGTGIVSGIVCGALSRVGGNQSTTSNASFK
jgi:hypothetical protein